MQMKCWLEFILSILTYISVITYYNLNCVKISTSPLGHKYFYVS